MSDIFDQIESKKDVFDDISPDKEDVFDKIAIFGGGQSGSGAGGEFEDKPAKWYHDVIELLTAGHVSFQPEPPPEVTRHPETSPWVANGRG
jgi:hypothetical protein